MVTKYKKAIKCRYFGVKIVLMPYIGNLTLAKKVAMAELLIDHLCNAGAMLERVPLKTMVNLIGDGNYTAREENVIITDRDGGYRVESNDWCSTFIPTDNLIILRKE